MNLNEFALTIKLRPTVTFMSRIKEWFMTRDEISICIAHQEVGDESGLHWQMVIKTTWEQQALRKAFLRAFPESKGKNSKKGNNYSIGDLRKAFEQNINYVLKCESDGSPDHMSIYKGMSKEEAGRLVNDMRDQYGGQTNVEGSKKKQNWNTMLLSYCQDADCQRDDRQAIGEAIMHFYRQKCKTQPNRFKLIEIITTIQILLTDENSAAEDRIISEIVSNAIRNDERYS